VALRDLADDREAEARAGAAVGALERLEDALGVIGGDAGAAVGDAELPAILRAGQPDVDHRPRGGVLQRVAEQVVERLPQGALVEAGGRRGACLDAELDTAGLGDGAQPRRGLADQLRQIAELAIEAEVAHGLEIEERARERAEAVDVVAHGAQGVAELLGGALLAQGEIDLGAEHGQRRAQLVSGAREQSILLGARLRDADRDVAERRVERAQLVTGRIGGQGGVSVAQPREERRHHVDPAGEPAREGELEREQHEREHGGGRERRGVEPDHRRLERREPGAEPQRVRSAVRRADRQLQHAARDPGDDLLGEPGRSDHAGDRHVRWDERGIRHVHDEPASVVVERGGRRELLDLARDRGLRQVHVRAAARCVEQTDALDGGLREEPAIEVLELVAAEQHGGDQHRDQEERRRQDRPEDHEARADAHSATSSRKPMPRTARIATPSAPIRASFARR